MREPIRHGLIIGGIGIVFALVILGLDTLGFFSVADARIQDRLLEPRVASDEIVIVAIDEHSIREYGIWPWPRILHAQLIDTLRVYDAAQIGYDVTFSEASTPAFDDALAEAIARAETRVILASEPTFQPLPSFAEAADAVGETRILYDGDGIVRHITFTGNTFAEQVTNTDASETARIPFVGPPGTFTTVSFVDVLQGDIPPETFKDKIVLVGATATDLHDEYLTPLDHDSPMSGVEIHANIIQSLQQGTALHLLAPTARAQLFLGLALLMILLASLLRLRYLLIATPAVLTVYLLAALAFASMGTLLPIIPALVLIVGLSALDLVIRYVREKHRRDWIERAFGHYLAPQVIQKLIKGETKLELGGVKEELTILFSDIRGFTSLSEKLSPEDLVKLLNEYLTAMTDVILKTEGVVDKYIGDAIMAFWGVPLPQEDHAIRAAMAAVRMKERLSELQTQWKKQGKPEVQIGIGINTGNVIIGNMGSKQRFDYTVMGDDVNLASRLEGLTKQYGVAILLSEATQKQLGNQFLVRELDLVAVKGKKQPVRIFELLGRDAPEDVHEHVRLFEEALAHYRAQRWEDALRILNALSSSDTPTEILTERCHALKKHPPGPDWDGVYHATEK